MGMREKLIELVGQVQDCGCDVTDVVEMNYVENNVLVDYLIANGVTIPVRCVECEYFKPAHFKADDGTEEPWDETFSFDGRSDGIYIGGKCKHDRNTAYGEKDMAFRKPDDFCSYGERRNDGI